MEWLSDFAGWLFDRMITASPGWSLFCVVMFTGGLVALIWTLIGRKGNVTLGPDPEPIAAPKQVAGGIYEWRTGAETVQDARCGPIVCYCLVPCNSVHDATTEVLRPLHPLSVEEYLPLAEEFGRRAEAVTEVIEQVIEVTRTTELVITIPEPLSLYPARHRREDVNAETRNLTDAIRRAKELAP